VLTGLAAGTLLCFDYDGTLAPLVDDPDRARMRLATQGLLTQLARARPVAVLTGRSLSSVLPLLHGTGVHRIVGGHGAERSDAAPDASLLQRVAAWREQVAAVAAAWPGVRVEEKPASLAVHYRQAKARHAAREAIAETASGLEGCRTLAGRDVLELVPEGAPDKGEALRRLVEEGGHPRVMYVGDDATDEDAFRALDDARLLSVRVGRRASAARYFVPDQPAVDRLLAALLHGAA